MRADPIIVVLHYPKMLQEAQLSFNLELKWKSLNKVLNVKLKFIELIVQNINESRSDNGSSP
jgi:hypothetical protein